MLQPPTNLTNCSHQLRTGLGQNQQQTKMKTQQSGTKNQQRIITKSKEKQDNSVQTQKHTNQNRKENEAKQTRCINDSTRKTAKTTRQKKQQLRTNNSEFLEEQTTHLQCGKSTTQTTLKTKPRLAKLLLNSKKTHSATQQMTQQKSTKNRTQDRTLTRLHSSNKQLSNNPELDKRKQSNSDSVQNKRSKKKIKTQQLAAMTRRNSKLC